MRSKLTNSWYLAPDFYIHTHKLNCPPAEGNVIGIRWGWGPDSQRFHSPATSQIELQLRFHTAALST